MPRAATLARIASTIRAALSLGNGRTAAASIRRDCSGATATSDPQARHALKPEGAPIGGALTHGGRRVLELLLGTKQGVEHLGPETLAERQGQRGPREHDQQLAPQVALALGWLGRLAQLRGRLADRHGRVLKVRAKLLVLEQHLGDDLAVVDPRVGALGRLERVDHILAQLRVLDQALDIGVVPGLVGQLGGSQRRLGLLLRWHTQLLNDDGGSRQDTRYPAARRRASAALRTSSIEETNTKLIDLRRWAGISSMSCSLSAGAITVRIPLR